MNLPELALAGGIGLGVGATWLAARKLTSIFRRNRPQREPPLFMLTPKDQLTLHQMYSGCLALGGVGSGKTSTLKPLMRALMQRGCGFLILTAKGTDFDDVFEQAVAAGRKDDLVLFEPGMGHCFSFLTYELNAKGGSISSAGQLLTDLVDAAMRSNTQASSEPFWGMAAARLLRMLMTIIFTASGRCSPEDLYQALSSLPASPEEATSPKWETTSFIARLLFYASELTDTPDLNMAADYVLTEWPSLGGRTAGSIRANAVNTLERFVTGTVRDLTCEGASTVTPDDIIQRGKIVAVNTPALIFREAGAMVQLAWKLSLQRAVLRRDLNEFSLPVVVWADEAHTHACESDMMVQAVARSHKLINVCLTQNINLVETVMGSKEKARAWLSNLTTKFLFANADYETNQYCSELLGNSRQLLMSGNQPTGPVDLLGEWMGQEEQHGSAGFSEQYLPEVQSGEFLKLRKGGEDNGFLVDGIVIQGGRIFRASGKTWLRGTWRQEV